MELINGEDLSQIIKRGPLPLEDALEFCKQMGEALEDAHEKGIIHRDLKPANIKVTEVGKIKVLDFGLAKAAVTESSSGVSSDSMSPTLKRFQIHPDGNRLLIHTHTSLKSETGSKTDHVILVEHFDTFRKDRLPSSSE